MQQFLHIIYTLAHYINVLRLQSSGIMRHCTLMDRRQYFGRTCCLHLLQGLAPVIFLPSLYHWPFFSPLYGFSVLKMELLDFFSILVNIYQTTQNHIPEGHNVHLMMWLHFRNIGYNLGFVQISLCGIILFSIYIAYLNGLLIHIVWLPASFLTKGHLIFFNNRSS
jgi:hypothetical protein